YALKWPRPSRPALGLATPIDPVLRSKFRVGGRSTFAPCWTPHGAKMSKNENVLLFVWPTTMKSHHWLAPSAENLRLYEGPPRASLLLKSRRIPHRLRLLEDRARDMQAIDPLLGSRPTA